MDWDIMRVKDTRARKHEKLRQDATLDRVVLKLRCKVCDAKLIKQQWFLPKEVVKDLRPLVEQIYNTPQLCQECK